MIASTIRIGSLMSSSACWNAIDKIESDYRNFYGGWSTWNSGKQVHMKKTAKNIVDAIEKRANKLSQD